MVDIDNMGPDLQLVVARFSNFLLIKVSLLFKLHGMSIFHDIQMATYFGTAWSYSHVVGYAGPTRTVYVGVTLTASKVKVNLLRLLNFRQLAKPCMLAAMTAAPLRGFLVIFWPWSVVVHGGSRNDPFHQVKILRLSVLELWVVTLTIRYYWLQPLHMHHNTWVMEMG